MAAVHTTSHALFRHALAPHSICLFTCPSLKPPPCSLTCLPLSFLLACNLLNNQIECPFHLPLMITLTCALICLQHALFRTLPSADAAPRSAVHVARELDRVPWLLQPAVLSASHYAAPNAVARCHQPSSHARHPTSREALSRRVDTVHEALEPLSREHVHAARHAAGSPPSSRG